MLLSLNLLELYQKSGHKERALLIRGRKGSVKTLKGAFPLSRVSYRQGVSCVVVGWEGDRQKLCGEAQRLEIILFLGAGNRHVELDSLSRQDRAMI